MNNVEVEKRAKDAREVSINAWELSIKGKSIYRARKGSIFDAEQNLEKAA